MNQLILFDVDSTLIDQEVIELIATHAGVESQVKQITDRAMAGEIDFAESLTARVSLLEGLSVSVLTDVQKAITLTNGATDLISNLQRQGDVVAVVSGGFLEVITPLMQELKIENFLANQLEISNGKLTGRVLGDIVDRKAKAEYLQHLKAQLHPTRTIAVGDGANDIDMIKSANIGIAFCAKSALIAEADHSIEVRDLREVLKFL